MFSVLFLFGRRGVAPMVGGMMLTNEWNFHLPLPQAMVLLFCQTFPVLLVLRYRTLAAGRALALRNTQPRHLATRFLVRVNDAVWHKNQYASGGALTWLSR
ncbi:protein YfeA [Salmonella enterica subsp. enterica]|uniref:Protein YfeA n=1 Tax=Salmonella enterica I TaxID=59201 RepID=A0A379WPN0_SALET|nr:protein YfeA [Salmonella enterica subsp. enterica]